MIPLWDTWIQSWREEASGTYRYKGPVWELLSLSSLEYLCITLSDKSHRFPLLHITLVWTCISIRLNSAVEYFSLGSRECQTSHKCPSSQHFWAFLPFYLSLDGMSHFLKLFYIVFCCWFLPQASHTVYQLKLQNLGARLQATSLHLLGWPNSVCLPSFFFTTNTLLCS